MLADWLFMGVLFHGKYRAHPEVWRNPTANPRSAMVGSALLNILTCAVILFSAGFLGLTSTAPAVYLSLTLWLAVALPILANWGLFAKIHPLVIVAHTLGWLVKLLAIGLIAAHFL